MNADLDEIKKLIISNNKNIKRYINKTFDEKFDIINKRFDEKFNIIDNKIDNINKKISVLSNKVNSTDSTLKKFMDKNEESQLYEFYINDAIELYYNNSYPNVLNLKKDYIKLFSQIFKEKINEIHIPKINTKKFNKKQMLTEFDGLFSVNDTLIIVESKRTMRMELINGKIQLYKKFIEFLLSDEKKMSNESIQIKNFFKPFKYIKYYFGALFWDINPQDIYINNDIITEYVSSESEDNSSFNNKLYTLQNKRYKNIDVNSNEITNILNLFNTNTYKLFDRPDLGFVNFENSIYKVYEHNYNISMSGGSDNESN